jgi:hypothetical protein
LIKIDLSNIGRIFGVLKSTLVAHRQSTGKLGDGVVNHYGFLLPRHEGRTQCQPMRSSPNTNAVGSEKVQPARR